MAIKISLRKKLILNNRLIFDSIINSKYNNSWTICMQRCERYNYDKNNIILM